MQDMRNGVLERERKEVGDPLRDNAWNPSIIGL